MGDDNLLVVGMNGSIAHMCNLSAPIVLNPQTQSYGKYLDGNSLYPCDLDEMVELGKEGNVVLFEKIQLPVIPGATILQADSEFLKLAGYRPVAGKNVFLVESFGNHTWIFYQHNDLNVRLMDLWADRLRASALLAIYRSLTEGDFYLDLASVYTNMALYAVWDRDLRFAIHALRLLVYLKLPGHAKFVSLYTMICEEYPELGTQAFDRYLSNLNLDFTTQGLVW